jgi:hypothetical protein
MASIPWLSRFFARVSFVVIPTTECPCRSNSAINGLPMAPLAPATNTRIRSILPKIKNDITPMLRASGMQNSLVPFELFAQLS